MVLLTAGLRSLVFHWWQSSALRAPQQAALDQLGGLQLESAAACHGRRSLTEAHTGSVGYRPHRRHQLPVETPCQSTRPATSTKAATAARSLLALLGL